MIRYLLNCYLVNRGRYCDHCDRDKIRNNSVKRGLKYRSSFLVNPDWGITFFDRWVTISISSPIFAQKIHLYHQTAKDNHFSKRTWFFRVKCENRNSLVVSRETLWLVTQDPLPAPSQDTTTVVDNLYDGPASVVVRFTRRLSSLSRQAVHHSRIVIFRHHGAIPRPAREPELGGPDDSTYAQHKGDFCRDGHLLLDLVQRCDVIRVTSPPWRRRQISKLMPLPARAPVENVGRKELATGSESLSRERSPPWRHHCDFATLLCSSQLKHPKPCY